MARPDRYGWIRVGLSVKAEDMDKITSELERLGYNSVASLVKEGLLSGRFSHGLSLTSEELTRLSRLKHRLESSRHTNDSLLIGKVLASLVRAKQPTSS